MSEEYHSSAHSKWNCKYHLVFVPKYQRKTIYGRIRKELGAIFHELARQKECRIIEGHLLIDHVHMCIEIPPKHTVSSIEGKSAIEIARRFSGRQRNFNGEHFWARICNIKSGVRRRNRESIHPKSRDSRQGRAFLA